MAVIVERARKMLKIQVPLETPVRSKSGKTLLVASSRGVVMTDVKYKGKAVALVLNAFIYPDRNDPGGKAKKVHEQPRSEMKGQRRRKKPPGISGLDEK